MIRSALFCLFLNPTPTGIILYFRFRYKGEFERLGWGLAGGSEGYIPRNPQPTPSQPPGNPQATPRQSPLGYEQMAKKRIPGIGVRTKPQPELKTAKGGRKQDSFYRYEVWLRFPIECIFYAVSYFYDFRYTGGYKLQNRTKKYTGSGTLIQKGFVPGQTGNKPFTKASKTYRRPDSLTDFFKRMKSNIEK